jgi:chaperonin cofactor prefoldin
MYEEDLQKYILTLEKQIENLNNQIEMLQNSLRESHRLNAILITQQQHIDL